MQSALPAECHVLQADATALCYTSISVVKRTTWQKTHLSKLLSSFLVHRCPTRSTQRCRCCFCMCQRQSHKHDYSALCSEPSEMLATAHSR